MPGVALNVQKKVGKGSQKTDLERLTEVAGSIFQALEELLFSYGLCLEEVSVGDPTGKHHKLGYHKGDRLLVRYNTKVPFSGSGEISYNNLCQSDRRIIKEIATLLDEPSCSNNVWQYLCGTIKGLPSLQLINSYREGLDGRVEITKTPGSGPGAQLSFRKEVEFAVGEMSHETGKTFRVLSATPLTIILGGDRCHISWKRG